MKVLKSVAKMQSSKQISKQMRSQSSKQLGRINMQVDKNSSCMQVNRGKYTGRRMKLYQFKRLRP
jgi:hypothetical protein